MGTIYKRKLAPEILLCHRLVGCQHKLLNNTVCLGSLILLDINRLSLFV